MSEPSSTELTRRFFNVDEANARLPLVRSIVKDITDLAHSMRDRHEALIALAEVESTQSMRERQEWAEDQLEQDREKLEAYVEELQHLGAELKDYFIGLVDFPGYVDGREVCLCWKLGENSIDYWHETHTGYGGRQPITKEFKLRCSQPRA